MKKNIAKIIAMILCISLVASVLVGCGSKPAEAPATEAPAAAAPEQKTDAPAKEPVEISLWHYWADNTEANLVALCDEYNAIQSEVKIVPTFVARNELMKQYTIGAVSGELPDIGLVDGPEMASYVALGVFEDITEQVKGWEDYDQFYPGPMSSCMDAEGNIYGIPDNTNCLALLCNMDMLNAAGFSEPPKTWSEFKEVAEKTSDAANGVYGFAMCAIGNEEGTYQLVPWLYGSGATVETMDSPEGIQFLTLLGDLVNNGWMSKEAANWTQGDALNAWVAGKAAMVESGPWQIGQLDNEYKDAVTWNYQYTAIPANDNGAQATVIGGENFGVCAGTEYKEECVEFLKWMNSKENNANFCEKTGMMPVRADSAASKATWTEEPRIKVFMDSMPFAVARGPHESWPKISEALYTAVQATLLGEKDPETAAKDAAATIKPILDEQPILKIK